MTKFLIILTVAIFLLINSAQGAKIKVQSVTSKPKSTPKPLPELKVDSGPTTTYQPSTLSCYLPLLHESAKFILEFLAQTAQTDCQSKQVCEFFSYIPDNPYIPVGAKLLEITEKHVKSPYLQSTSRTFQLALEDGANSKDCESNYVKCENSSLRNIDYVMTTFKKCKSAAEPIRRKDEEEQDEYERGMNRIVQKISAYSIVFILDLFF